MSIVAGNDQWSWRKSMKISCPHCGVSGSADDSYLGRKVQCPKCHGVFPIEQEGMEQQSPGVLLPDESIAEPEQVSGLPDTDTDAEEISTESDDESTPVVQESEPDTADVLAAEEKTPARIATEVELESEPADGTLAEENADLEDVIEDTGDETISIAVDEIEEEDSIALELEEEGSPDEMGDLGEEGAEKLEDELILEVLEDDIAAEESVEGVPGEEDITQEPAKPAVEDEPYGLGKEQCWQCGKADSVGEPFIAKDGRLYCTECLPVDEDIDTADVLGIGALGSGGQETAAGMDETVAPPPPGRFTIGGALREAWDRANGAKGSIWAASAIMYLVILVFFAGTAAVVNMFAASENLLFSEIGSFALQSLTDIISMIFTAGLMYMGVKRAAGKKINWKMGLEGFSCAGRIIIATILQTIMVMIGFLLLILPGIYLTIGYSMTLPLIIDKGLSPWQAMETSRKAVHKVWWKIFGLYIAAILIFLVAMIPLFLGLIWVWPMLFVLAGVVYRYLFSASN